jgi:hypothetical protein
MFIILECGFPEKIEFYWINLLGMNFDDEYDFSFTGSEKKVKQKIKNQEGWKFRKFI